MFCTLSKISQTIWVTFILSSANAFNLVYSKIFSLGKELKHKTPFSFLLYSRISKSWLLDVYLSPILKDTIVKTKSNFSIIPFPNKPWFLRVCSTSLFKTLLQKEKLPATSNFSLSYSVSTCFDSLLPFSSSLKLSSANSFSLERSKICRLGKGYPHCSQKLL